MHPLWYYYYLIAQIPACNEGPSFWCKDLQNAEYCGVVPLCVEEYWIPQALNEQLFPSSTGLDDNTCSRCISVLQNNAKNLEAFSGICDSFDDPETRLICTNFISSVENELIRNTSTQEICQWLGQCEANNADDDGQDMTATTATTTVTAGTEKGLTGPINEIEKNDDEDTMIRETRRGGGRGGATFTSRLNARRKTYTSSGFGGGMTGASDATGSRALFAGIVFLIAGVALIAFIIHHAVGKGNKV